MSSSIVQMKVVWGIVTRGAQTIWSRVGVAWEGPHGALFVRLDAVPISGEMCIKEWGPAAEVGEEPRMAFGVVGASPYVPAVAHAEPTS